VNQREIGASVGVGFLAGMLVTSAKSAASNGSVAVRDLFDFQVNGFAGVDFQSEKITALDLRRAVDALTQDGVAGIFLALITDTEDRLVQQFERLTRIRAADPTIAAMIRGFHLEGPWLSPKPGFCGAHPRELMCAPSLAMFERLQRAAGGLIRLVTLAPEWPGSAKAIAAVTASGVHVSLGHTAASEAEIDAAIAAGARFCTHLGNGIPLELPRHDNVMQRLLARDALTACFIPDGLHLPHFVLRNLVRAKPPGRVLFTTDAMAAAGVVPNGGVFTLGGRREIHIGADGVARDSQGGFAGSTITPSRGVVLTAQMLGLDPADAHRLWSSAAQDALLSRHRR
jgi:N-acetylglucosamine-6-phosphate deacetylase